MTPDLQYLESDESTFWGHSLDDEMTRFFGRKQRVIDVEKCFERLASKSPFLQTRRPADVAHFHRSEVKTGRLLGKGGFAHVYEITGFDLGTNPTSSGTSARLREAMAAEPHKYVLKQIKPSAKNYVIAAADMAMEAALLLRFEDHPNCISLKALPSQWLKACEEEDGFFLVLEKVDTTLEAQMKLWDTASTSSIPTEQVRFRYAQEMASVLQHLHQQGLVYRDMKPNNVGLKKQIDGSYTIKLFDFGLCRGMPEGEQSSQEMYTMSCVGTPLYAAPEVLAMMLNNEKRGQYNSKVDVYGWAVVVWQLFALSKAKAMHLTMKSVPDALQSILLHSWLKSIDRRSDFKTVLNQLKHIEPYMVSGTGPKKPLKARFSALLRRGSAVAV